MIQSRLSNVILNLFQDLNDKKKEMLNPSADGQHDKSTRTIIVLCFLILIFLFTPRLSYALEDPGKATNNRMGIHILFPEELDSASQLVNSNGGDWGYVIIPIQAGDRDIYKWQNFMNKAREKHVIPILRLATQGDYFNTSVWEKPNKNDVLDFANFLNSLEWPVENQYVVIFNEVNRHDEWEGLSNAKEYAEVLDYSVDIFKSLNLDFFIISAGLDNAFQNNQYEFLKKMNDSSPGIFEKIDGLGSHSYPNPAFSSSPSDESKMSISSFRYEKELVFDLSGKDLPIFITETGWSSENLSKDKIADYFNYAFENVWSDESIAAVTPFLLRAGAGPFQKFSVLDENGQNNPIYQSLFKLSKTKGNPSINNARSKILGKKFEYLPLKKFPKKDQTKRISKEEIKPSLTFLRWILKV
jgi:hypothetical protein